MRSKSPTEAATPSCTHVIDASVIRAPVRAVVALMEPSSASATVRVHVTCLDTPFS
jgi:hypothetical protein